MPETKIKDKHNAWIVAVDMGYGHQRAAYPLRELDHQQVINANNYQGIPAKDKKIWKQSRSAYEAFTRFKRVPVIGEFVWNILKESSKKVSYNKESKMKNKKDVDPVVWLEKKYPTMTDEFKRIQRNNINYFVENNMIMAL